MFILFIMLITFISIIIRNTYYFHHLSRCVYFRDNFFNILHFLLIFILENSSTTINAMCLDPVKFNGKGKFIPYITVHFMICFVFHLISIDMS